MKKAAFIIVTLAFLLTGAAGLKAQLVSTVVAVTGNIINQADRQPVSVTFFVEDQNGKRINKATSNSKSGYYYVTGLKPGRQYYFTINEDGWFKQKIEIRIPDTDKYLELSRDILAYPKKEGVRIKIPVPPFELNKSKLRFGAAFLLNNFSETLRINPDVSFKIVSYPDKDQPAEENLGLTKDRANSIKDFLVIEGISPERIETEGKSLTDPENPPPAEKRAKGKRYIGPSYIVVTDLKN
ncbi:MAG: OmpA family protein [Candidatus Kapaibacterium sp.]